MDDQKNQYVTFTLEGQMFGLPVLQVHDVLQDQRVNHVPLAPIEVAGSLNLRGRIVTAIDLRRKLGLPHKPYDQTTMSIVVEYENEKYSLIVDSVGDVITIENSRCEKVPGTIDQHWREISHSVFKLQERLMLVLDVKRFFNARSVGEVAA